MTLSSDVRKTQENAPKPRKMHSKYPLLPRAASSFYKMQNPFSNNGSDIKSSMETVAMLITMNIVRNLLPTRIQGINRRNKCRWFRTVESVAIMLHQARG